jgi:hypothetical protein
MVSRIADSTSGCPSNLPAMCVAARSSAVRTLMSAIRFHVGPDLVCSAACPRTS